MSGKVVILRGVPGAGKSAFIKNNFPADVSVCSADSYFINDDRKYEFRPELIGEAHNACMRKFIFLTANDTGHSLVIVDNTGIYYSEVSPYVLVAQSRSYEVQVIRLVIDPAIAAARNVHNVPPALIHRMDHMMERCPPFVKERVLTWNNVRKAYEDNK